jgi:hypothetical protein
MAVASEPVKILSDILAEQRYDDLNKIPYVNILRNGFPIARINGTLKKGFTWEVWFNNDLVALL